MIQAKIKQVLINILFIVLAFTVQNCVFPLLPFLSATPNLLLILTFSFGFIHGKNAGMFYGVLSGLLLDLFYSGPFGFYTLIYIYIGYANGIFTKYYYEDYITLPLILSIFNGIWYSMYIYIIPLLNPRTSESSLLFQEHHASGDYIYCSYHSFDLQAVPFRQQTCGGYRKKERHKTCLTNC